MAIYRKGEASLAADGTVTGYGTNWKDQLALVRIGATVVFLTGNAISAIGTVSAIVSETQLQTIQTDGAVVARGKYFILLHDSLTVDGLAQNVAETLRYYQSQETEIAEAIDYFRTFDWEKFEKIATSVKTNAAAAKVSETNAKTSETNSKASENASAASKDAAAASAAAAKTSETNSKTSETNSKASENAANGSKVAAAGSATAADASAKAGAASQAAAKTSETNAKTSETNAKASENASLQSKNAAAGSATAAKTSETNAKTSETRSKTSETNSAASAVTATNEADRAKREADRAAAANPDNSLLKANNLSDVPDKAAARTNLQINRFNQDSASETRVLSGDGTQAVIVSNSVTWGVYKFGSGWIPLGVSQGGTGSTSAAGARTNLQLGLNDSPEFAAVYARAGIEVRTASDGAEPSASLVARRSRANGTTIVSSENRANANGSIEWIKRDASGSPRAIVLTEDNFVTFNGLTPAPAAIELGIKNPNSTSVLDFHYGAKYDFDARIVCDGMNSEQAGGGNLRFYAGYINMNTKGSYQFDGGRFNIATTDFNIRCPAITYNEFKLSGGNITIPGEISATAPLGGGLRGMLAGVDSADFNNAANINLYSWYGIGFCTSYTSPINGVLQGKPAVYINTRDGTINAKGAVQANGVTLTSDWNAKTDISIIDPEKAMEMITKLDGWKFRYKDSDSKRMTAGIIAQDLDLVIPDLVIKPEPTPEVDIDGNVVIDEETGKPVNDGDSNLTADYMGLMGYMIAAIKHAGIKNEHLQSQVDDLKSQVEDLKAMVEALIAK